MLSVVAPFCAVESAAAESAAGSRLRQLRLNHNAFYGELPACLMQLRILETLRLFLCFFDDCLMQLAFFF